MYTCASTLYGNIARCKPICKTNNKSLITFFFFRHKEAIKLNQTLKASLKSNNNDALTITSLLVDGFEKNIPNIMKNDYGRLPLQSVYKKPS